MRLLAPLAESLPIVVDPVMGATRGSGRARFVDPRARASLALLASLPCIVTPNAPKRQRSSATRWRSPMRRRAARSLVARGARAALVKGGHLGGSEAVDVLVIDGQTIYLAAPRIRASLHGTGCTLASLIAGGSPCAEGAWIRRQGNHPGHPLGQAQLPRAMNQAVRVGDGLLVLRHEAAFLRLVPLGLFAVGLGLSARPITRRPAAPPAPIRSGAAAGRGQLAEGLPKVTGAMVFAGPLRSDEPAPRADDLVARLAALVAGALGQGTGFRASPQRSQPRRRSRAAPRRLCSWIRNRPRRAPRRGGHLQRHAQRLGPRAPPISPAERACVRQRANRRRDPRIFAPVPLLASHIDRIATDDRDVLALACGDVDADGALEVVTLGRRRVAIGRARHGRFVAAHSCVARKFLGRIAGPAARAAGRHRSLAGRPRGCSARRRGD